MWIGRLLDIHEKIIIMKRNSERELGADNETELETDNETELGAENSKRQVAFEEGIQQIAELGTGTTGIYPKDEKEVEEKKQDLNQLNKKEVEEKENWDLLLKFLYDPL